MTEPVFYYGFNSRYAYLAAMRVGDVLPVRAATVAAVRAG